MMKRNYLCGMLAIIAAIAVSCSKEPAQSETTDGDLVDVHFSTKADLGLTGNRTRASFLSTDYGKDNFAILQFKHDGNDYLYQGLVPMDKMSWDDDRNTLSGTLRLAPGDYGFVPTYGLMNNNTTAKAYMQTFPVGSPYINTAQIGANISNPLPEIFLDNMHLSDLRPYTVALDGTPAPQVNMSVRRAVGRIDVLIVRGDETSEGSGQYAEKEGTSIYGYEGNVSLVKWDVKNANALMDFTGVPLASSVGTLNFTHMLPHADATVNDNVVYGYGTSSSVVNSEYSRNYNEVQAEDIIKGGTYIRGPHMIAPAADQARQNVSLTLYITDVNGTATREVQFAAVPVVRNKVTILKLYLLGDEDPDNPGPSIYDANLKFEVAMIREWDGNEIVEGVIE